MTVWLDDAIAYTQSWLSYQMGATQLPGCVVAVVKDGEVVAELAFGVADIRSGEVMTPAHRFRVASHSKTFTAAAILKLREAGRLHLDDAIGGFVPGLHDRLAEATIEQLLCHGAGVSRDGSRADFWGNTGPFLDLAGLRAALGGQTVIDGGTRLKYSNIGYSLLGLLIEAISDELYAKWIEREIVTASDLKETTADLYEAQESGRLASGHSGIMPFGRRPMSGIANTRAMAAATGFVSTAADLARFFNSLSPNATKSVLSVASRRSMALPRWPLPGSPLRRGYGLGTVTGEIGGHGCFGHGGAFPGFLTRTVTVPDWGITVSVLTNAIDGYAAQWAEGIIDLFNVFSERGPALPHLQEWSGRWWSIWSAIDLVPVGDRLLVGDPAALQPLDAATEITVSDATSGVVTEAFPMASFGETVQRHPGGASSKPMLQIGALTYCADPADLSTI